MRPSLILTAALPCLVAGAAAAADLDVVRREPVARPVTVTRVAEACPPVPMIVRPGRRGMGEPGTFYAYWGWVRPRACEVVIAR